jgi:hypothetical protein
MWTRLYGGVFKPRRLAHKRPRVWITASWYASRLQASTAALLGSGVVLALGSRLALCRKTWHPYVAAPSDSSKSVLNQ